MFVYLCSLQVQRPVGQGQEPTRRPTVEPCCLFSFVRTFCYEAVHVCNARLVLPSAQKEKKIPPRRSLSGSLEPAGSPANAKPTPKAQVAHMAEVGQVAQIAQVVQVAQVAPDPAKDGDQKAKDSSQKATAQAAPPAQDDSNARTPDKASQQEGKTANGTAAQESVASSIRVVVFGQLLHIFGRGAVQVASEWRLPLPLPRRHTLLLAGYFAAGKCSIPSCVRVIQRTACLRYSAVMTLSVDSETRILTTNSRETIWVSLWTWISGHTRPTCKLC